MSTLTALRPLTGDDSSRSDGESSALCGSENDPHTVTTSPAHVRIAHANYSAKNPELVSALVEMPHEVSFTLYVPALNEILTYRAPILGDAA